MCLFHFRLHHTFDSFSKSIIGAVNSELAEIIKLANDFNDLVSIITTRYNLIVSKGKNGLAQVRWASLSKDLKRKASVDIKAINTKLNIQNSKLVIFLSMVQEALYKGDINEVDRLIINREVRIKNPSRAKTMHAGEYLTDVWIGVDKFDYRFTPARRIIIDIMDAEDSKHV